MYYYQKIGAPKWTKNKLRLGGPQGSNLEESQKQGRETSQIPLHSRRSPNYGQARKGPKILSDVPNPRSRTLRHGALSPAELPR
jgi:hypothetical protein